MSSFSAEWLARREPADHHARSHALVTRLAGRWPESHRIRALDLGAGTGSNVRYLTRHLGDRCDWVLADQDAGLLARAQRSLAQPVATRVLNLMNVDALRQLIADREVVTASALLDLVSEPWLRGLLEACAAQHASVLFALSYDGRMGCEPHEPEDALVRRLVNQHQQTDKGFGPALGPAATDRAAAVLEELGYHVWRDRSDWVLTGDAELQSDLVSGWASAAIELAREHEPSITEWRARRLAHIHAGRSNIIVGHEDLAGVFASTS